MKIAKEWFTVSDLTEIRTHKIGMGKIGGKSAGMLLAARILMETADEEIRSCIKLPESYFIGADLTYTFMALNGLMHWADQKYKLEDQIRSDYPRIKQEFLKGEFPPDHLLVYNHISLNQRQVWICSAGSRGKHQALQRPLKADQFCNPTRRKVFT